VNSRADVDILEGKMCFSFRNSTLISLFCLNIREISRCLQNVTVSLSK
jgi:hypothetical protein